jgi:hypothetical protein
VKSGRYVGSGWEQWHITTSHYSIAQCLHPTFCYNMPMARKTPRWSWKNDPSKDLSFALIGIALFALGATTMLPSFLKIGLMLIGLLLITIAISF